jgi:hypothetical protein|tara:strand:- start:7186 stop:8007 length:822 start_codon:yes stop_codon:yes gene_type:complete
MNKYVVFDLDETLGYFTQLGIFWDCLSKLFKLNQTHFNELCNMFPKVFRSGIFPILSYLIRKKKKDPNIKILIYTNNQGPKSWTYMIKNYIDYKLKNSNIFDQVICAFKVNNIRVEMCRTTYNKTISDLLRCTNAPDNSKFIFFDDQYHKDMINDKVNYINMKPYNYQIAFTKMISVFMNSKLSKTLQKQINLKKKELKDILIEEIDKYDFNVIEISKKEYKLDKNISKKMMMYLKDFFNDKSNKRKSKLNNTQKNKLNNTQKNKLNNTQKNK